MRPRWRGIHPGWYTRLQRACQANWTKSAPVRRLQKRCWACPVQPLRRDQDLQLGRAQRLRRGGIALPDPKGKARWRQPGGLLPDPQPAAPGSVTRFPMWLSWRSCKSNRCCTGRAAPAAGSSPQDKSGVSILPSRHVVTKTLVIVPSHRPPRPFIEKQQLIDTLAAARRGPDHRARGGWFCAAARRHPDQPHLRQGDAPFRGARFPVARWSGQKLPAGIQRQAAAQRCCALRPRPASALRLGG